MSDFNSTYNDIQKQISFANLTDQQIQELINVAENGEVMPKTKT